jgi:Galactose oxidase, central domain/Kelch motif
MHPTGHRFSLSHFVSSCVALAATAFLLLPTPIRGQIPFSSWKATSPLPFSLAGYTLTPLRTGEILLAGGIGSTGVTNAAFLYNPTNHSFTPTSHLMNLARFNHTATLLPDGTVVIAGGDTPQQSTGTVACSAAPPAASFSNVVTSCAELYDPVTDSFRLVGSMNVARAGHTATLVDQTLYGTQAVVNPPPLVRVVVAGGFDNGGNAMNSLEYYDPSSQKFGNNPQTLQQARRGHTATWIPSTEKILIAGGTDASGNALGTAELYSAAFDGIRGVVPMISARAGHTATLLKNGSVLIAGGENNATLDTAEIFDPVSETFAGTPGKMAFPMTSHAAALMSDGSVLLAGGDGPDVAHSPIASAQLFNPNNQFFLALPSMITARRGFEMGVAVGSNEVLAPGGEQFAGGGPFATGISASEVFAPIERRVPGNISLDYCENHPIACQILRQRVPLVLSSMVHHSMVIAPFPRPSQPLRDRKGPIYYRIAVTGLGDGWDAAVVDENGALLRAQRSQSREPLILTLAFNDSAAFEAAQDSSVLVFQMTEKAAVGKEYPISVKAEVVSRPEAGSGARNP